MYDELGTQTAVGTLAVEDDARERHESEPWLVDAPGRWWVLHTRARNEKRVAEMLDEQHVCLYLPLVCVHRTYTKCQVTSRLPLFPGYLFLCGDLNDCDKARRTNRVANVIEVENQDQLRAELRDVYRVVESGETVDLFPALQEGQRCRIVGGGLKGMEGVVIRHGRRFRMYLAVSTLGQSAVVEVDAALLEVVN